MSQQQAIDHQGLKTCRASKTNRMTAYILSKPDNPMSKQFLANANTSCSFIFKACVPAVDTVTQVSMETILVRAKNVAR